MTIVRRYAQRRHRGPPKATKYIEVNTVQDKNGLWHNVAVWKDRAVITIRDFWLHPTKGWRSSGPR